MRTVLECAASKQARRDLPPESKQPGRPTTYSGAQKMTNMNTPTVQNFCDQQQRKFLALSTSRQNALRREARAFIFRNPGCADHSNFWRGLSARQVLAAD
jgi:hypothetical protein